MMLYLDYTVFVTGERICIIWVAEWWQRKTKVFRGRPVPVPLCPPHIPHKLLWEKLVMQCLPMAGQKVFNC